MRVVKIKPVLIAVCLVVISLYLQLQTQVEIPLKPISVPAQIDSYNQQYRFNDSLNLSLNLSDSDLITAFADVYQAALDNREISHYQSHNSPINLAVFSPDGRYIASTDQAGHIHIYDIETATVTKQWQADHKIITHLQFSPNSQQLLSISQGGVLRLWQLKDDSYQLLAYGQKQAQFHPKQPYLIAINQKIAQIWRDNGDFLDDFAIEVSSHYLDFNQQGDKLLMLGQDYAIRIWGITQDTFFKFKIKRQNLLLGHSDSINHAVFDSSGDYLLSGGQDQKVRLWNLYNNGKLLQLETSSPIIQVGFRPKKRGIIAQSQDAIQLWTRQGDLIQKKNMHENLKLYHLKTQDKLLSLQNNGQVYHWQLPDLLTHYFNLPTPIVGSDYHLPTQQLLTYNHKHIYLWQAKKYQVTTLKPPQADIQQIRLSPDQQWLAVATNNQGLQLLDTGLKKPPIQLGTIDSAIYSFLFKDQQLILGSANHYIEIWQWQKQQKIKSFKVQQGSVVQLDLRADGQQFLSRSLDNSVALWSLAGDLQALFYPQAGDLVASGYRHDNKQVYTLQNDLINKKYSAFLWDTSGKLQHRLNIASPAQYADYHPKRQQLAIGAEDGHIYIWSWQTDQQTPRLRRINAHKSAITQLKYSPDANYLFSSSLDGSYQLRDAFNDALYHDFPRIKNWVEYAEFSADSQHLLIHDYQKGSILWHLYPVHKRLTWQGNQDTAVTRSILTTDDIWLQQGQEILTIPLLNDTAALRDYVQKQIAQ